MPRGASVAYGGKYVAETLMFSPGRAGSGVSRAVGKDPAFQRELDDDLAQYVGRPSPLYEAKRWSESGRRGPHITSSARTSITPAPTR